MPNSDSSPPNFCTVGVFVQKKGQERCNFENITDTWARHLSKTEGGEKYGGKSRLGMIDLSLYYLSRVSIHVWDHPFKTLAFFSCGGV